jgi:hypothetical protein
LTIWVIPTEQFRNIYRLVIFYYKLHALTFGAGGELCNILNKGMGNQAGPRPETRVSRENKQRCTIRPLACPPAKLISTVITMQNQTPAAELPFGAKFNPHRTVFAL